MNTANRKKFIVSINVDGVATSHIWDSTTKQRIGFSIPWSLRTLNDGNIELHHDKGQEFHLANINDKNFQPVNLPVIDGLPRVPVSLKLSEIDELDLPFVKAELPLNPAAGEHQWRVHCSTGQWVLYSQTLAEEFICRRSGSDIFSIQQIAPDQYKFTIIAEGVSSDAGELRGDFLVTAEMLANLQLRHRSCVWHFEKVWSDDPDALPVFSRKDPDPEGRWFRRITVNTALGCASLFLLVWIFGAPQPVEKLPPVQIAKVIIRPKATGAGTSSTNQSMPNIGDASSAKESADLAPGKPSPDKASLDTPKATEKVAKKGESQNLAEQKKSRPELNETANSQNPANLENKTKNQEPAPKNSSESLRKAEALQKSLSGLLGKNSLAIPKTQNSAGGGLVQALHNTGGAPNKNSGGSSLDGNGKVNVGFSQGSLSGSLPSGSNAGGLSIGGAGGESGLSFVSIGGKSGGGAIAEGLTKEEVWEVIRKHLHEIRYCYEMSILRNPKLQGKILVAFVINAEGTVKNHSVKESELKDPPLNQCVLGRLATWKFPKPKGRINVDVQYPFVFRRL